MLQLFSFKYCKVLTQCVMDLFSQIYNEQIGDLLDPTQRNLEVEIFFILDLFLYTYVGLDAL